MGDVINELGGEFDGLELALAHAASEQAPGPEVKVRLMARVRELSTAPPELPKGFSVVLDAEGGWRPHPVAGIRMKLLAFNRTRRYVTVLLDVEPGGRFPPHEALLRAEASERKVAELRRVTTEAQGQIVVLAAPDVARVDLIGQSAAPSAMARAFWSRSRGLVFTATDLPALPAGRTYQLWVVTARAPISAGLVRPDATGRASMIFETPPDIPPPVAMALTLEPEGGVPAPTGARYLVGTPAL